MFSKAPLRYCRGLCKTRPFLLHQGSGFVLLGENTDFGCGVVVWSVRSNTPLCWRHIRAEWGGQTRGVRKEPRESQLSALFPRDLNAACVSLGEGGADGNAASCCCLLWAVSGLWSWEVTCFSSWHSGKKYSSVHIAGQWGIGIVLVMLSAPSDKSCRINDSLGFTFTTKAVWRTDTDTLSYLTNEFTGISICCIIPHLSVIINNCLSGIFQVLRNKHNSKWKQGAVVSFNLWRSHFFVIIFQRICL